MKGLAKQGYILNILLLDDKAEILVASFKIWVNRENTFTDYGPYFNLVTLNMTKACWIDYNVSTTEVKKKIKTKFLSLNWVLDIFEKMQHLGSTLFTEDLKMLMAKVNMLKTKEVTVGNEWLSIGIREESFFHYLESWTMVNAYQHALKSKEITNYMAQNSWLSKRVVKAFKM